MPHRILVNLLRVLIIVSLLLNMAPPMGRAASFPAPEPQGVADPPTAATPSRLLSTRALPSQPGEPATESAEVEPLDTPENVELHTIFLPLVARNAQPTADVQLETRVEPWLALPGDVVTYTLEVISTGQLAVADGRLEKGLPEQIEVLEVAGEQHEMIGRQLRWQMDQLTPGRTISVTVRARVLDESEMTEAYSPITFTARSLSPSAEQVFLEHGEPVTASASVSLLVGEAITHTLTAEGGVLNSPREIVRLEAPAGAVTQTTEVRVTDFLPPTPRPEEPRWVTIFDVEAVGEAGAALRDADGHTRFLHPLTATVDLRDQVGWMDAYLMHFEDEAGQAITWTTHIFDPEAEVLTATLQTFSGYGTALDNPFPTDGSHFLFQDWPGVDLYGGSVSYQIPIETPPAVGGINPSLSLNYSSRSMDGMLGVVQSSDVGMGWSVGGTAAVVRKIKTRPQSGYIRWRYKNTFTLMVGGSSHRLVGREETGAGCRYYTRERSGLRVMLYNGLCGYKAEVGRPDNETGEYWEVTTASGVRYRLGATRNSEQVTLMGWYAPDKCDLDGCRDNRGRDKPDFPEYAGDQANLIASRWSVDRMVDTHGNEIKYQYLEEGRHSNNQDWDRASHLHYVEYGGQDLPHYTVEFEFEKRKDANGNWHDDGPPSYRIRSFTAWEKYRVEAIRVSVSGNIIREYVLRYRTPTLEWPGYEWIHHNHPPEVTELAAVQEYGTGGRGGGEALPSVKLSYQYMTQADENVDPRCGYYGEQLRYPRLARVDNGYGGWVQFHYQAIAGGGVDIGSKQVGCNKATSDLPARRRCGSVYSYRVIKQSKGDGMGQKSWNEYSYEGSCFATKDSPCRRDQRKTFALIGHRKTRVIAYDYSGVELNRTDHYYITDKEDALGREWATQRNDSDGIRLQRENKVWKVKPDYEGIKGRYAIELEKTTTCVGDACQETSYTYDRYGNLEREWNHGDITTSGDERTLYRQYHPNTTTWIVNKVTRESLYEGIQETDYGWDTNLESRTWYRYDGQTEWDTPPQDTGELTAVDRWNGGVGGMGILLRDTTATYEYNSYGNVVSQTDALSRVATTSYDRVYQQFPIRTCQAMGAEEAFQCNYSRYYGVHQSMREQGTRFGEVYAEWGPNGEETATYYRYDPFGRVKTIARPGDSLELPTVAYDYALETERVFYTGFEETCEQGRLTGDNGEWWKFAANVHCRQSDVYAGKWAMEIHGPNSRKTTGSAVLDDPIAFQSNRSYRVRMALRGQGGLSVNLSFGDRGWLGAFSAPLEDPWRWFEGVFTPPNANYQNGQLHLWARQPIGSVTALVDEITIDRVSGLRVTETRREESKCADCVHQTDYLYDGLGRAVRVRAETEEGWRVTTRDFDGLDRVVREHLPRLENQAGPAPYTATRYDALGRVVRVTNPDGTATTTTYDGWTTTITDANGHWKSHTNDGLGRLVTVVENDAATGGLPGYQTTYAYDARDNLTDVWDAAGGPSGGNHTQMAYDALGRKIWMDDPDMGKWHYHYDLAGNLIAQVDAERQAINFYYDDLNRLRGKTYDEGPLSSPQDYERPDDPGSYPVAYTYDAYAPWDGQYGRGLRTGMNYPGGSASYTYDVRGRVTQETRTFDVIGDYVTRYTYDALDRVATMTYPDGEIVTQEYDAAGRAETLSSSRGEQFVESTLYNPQGQMTRIYLGNDLSVNYDYYSASENNNRLERILIPGLLDLAYDYDDVGNVKTITDRWNDDQVQHFTYDALDRLTHAWTSGGGEGQYDESYSYDEIGNMLSKDGRTYTYPDPGQPQPHAVTALSDGSHFEYDPNGNMTLRVEHGPTQTVAYAQEFDLESRLAAVTSTNGITQTVTRFGYDGDGARVWQVTEEGATIYVGEYYEEFLPGLGADDLLPGGGTAMLNDGRGVAEAQPLVLWPKDKGKSREAGEWRIPGLAAPAMRTLADLVGDNFAIASDGVRQIIPAIAHNSQNGEYLVVWLDDRNGAGSDIYGLRLNSNGGYVGETAICTVAASTQEWAAVAYNSQNNQYLVVWQDNRNGNYDIYAQRLSSNGALLGEISVSAAANDQHKPAVIYNSTNNQYLIVWEDYRNGNDNVDVYAQILDADGTLDGANFAIREAPGEQSTPNVAYNSQNNQYLVVWNEAWTDIYSQRISAGGGLLGQVLVSAGVANSQGLPDVAYNSQTNEYLVVWTGNLTNYYNDGDIYGRLMDANGTLDSADAFIISNVAASEKRAAIAYNADSNDYLVVWDSGQGNTSPGSPYDIYGRRVTGDGETGGSRFSICTASYGQFSPDLAYNSTTSEFLVVWDDYRNGSPGPGDIYAQRVDVSPPSVPAMAAEPAWTRGTGNTVSWSASQPDVDEYRLQQATSTSFAGATDVYPTSTSYSFTGLDNGQIYYYRVRTRDQYDNWSDWSNVVHSVQDDRSPTNGDIQINSGDEWTNVPTVTLALSASDPQPGSGVAEMRFCNGTNDCSTGGSSWSSWRSYSGSTTWTLPDAQGERRVYVRFRDAVGNVSAISSAAIGLDTQPPTNTLVHINDDAETTNSQEVTLDLLADDGTSGSGVVDVRFRNDGESWSAWEDYNTSRSWTLRDKDGPCTVYVHFRDRADNTTLDSDTIELDRVPPSLTLTQPEDGLATGALLLTVEGQTEVSATVQVGVEESGWRSAPWTLSNETFTLPVHDLAQGENTIVITATDQALNSTAVTRTVHYDTAGPRIADLAPVGPVADAQPTISASFAITGGAAISPTTASIYLDGRDVTASATITTGGFTLVPASPLEEGEHQMEVEVYDTVGNRDEAVWQFVVDLSTWVTITHPSEEFNRLSATVAGEAEAGVTVTLQVDGSPAGTAQAGADGRYAIADAVLSAGDNLLVVTASDSLGHTAAATRTVTVDLAAPWAEAEAHPPTFSPGGALGSTTFALTGTAPAGESLSIWRFAVLDGSAPVTQTGGMGEPVPTLVWDGQSLPEGIYDYTLVVTATNGRTYAAPPRQVTLDLTPPAAPTITWPISGTLSDEGLIRVEGSAEPGAFVTLLDGGAFTTTLESPADGDGRWAGEYPLHGGRNLVWAVADDATGVASPPSNQVVMLHVVHPPLYDVGTDPTTVASGGATTLWADARGAGHPDGAPTAGAWAIPPYGDTVELTHTSSISGGQLWRWEGVWPVPSGLPSHDTTVYFQAVDEDNLSGDGEIGIGIRNTPPEPAIVYPAWYLLSDPHLLLRGRVESVERLSVRVWDRETQVGQARSVNWNPTLGVNWQTAITLTGEGLHPLSADAVSDFGLASERGPTRTFLLDLFPPTVTLGALPPFTNSESLPLAWQGDDGAGSGVAAYGLEHRLDGGSWETWTTGGPGYTSTPFGLYPEGAHGFRVWAQDEVRRQGWSAERTVVADRTEPTVRLTLSEHSDYAHVDGVALFYGPFTGAFTITAALEDATAGLDAVAFPETTGLGGTYPQSGVTEATVSHVYTFTAASTLTAAPAVTATDRATNVTTDTFRLTRDATPPNVWLDAPRRVYSGAASIPVTWGATDDTSGVARYDVQVRVEGGDWTTWLTDTLATEATYVAEEGEWFTFRVTATDNVGNQASVETSSHVARMTKYYYHGGQRVAQRRDGVVYYLHGDHLGSTSLATDAGGAKVSRVLYYPYGAERYAEGALPTDFTFTGQRKMPGLGLMHYGARYYHPLLGRFISADTIVPEPSEPQDLNRYAYVRNNPLRHRDPTGHKLDPGGAGGASRRESEEALDVTPMPTPPPPATPMPTLEPPVQNAPTATPSPAPVPEPPRPVSTPMFKKIGRPHTDVDLDYMTLWSGLREPIGLVETWESDPECVMEINLSQIPLVDIKPLERIHIVGLWRQHTVQRQLYRYSTEGYVLEVYVYDENGNLTLSETQYIHSGEVTESYRPVGDVKPKWFVVGPYLERPEPPEWHRVDDEGGGFR